MDESVRHRIIGGVVLAVMALSLIPILIHFPPRQSSGELESTVEPLTPENKVVEYEERWHEPTPIASVNLDKDQENVATEAVEAEPILKNVKFSHPAKPVEKPIEKLAVKASVPVPATPTAVHKPIKKVVKNIVHHKVKHKAKHKVIQPSKIKPSPTWAVQLASFSKRKNAIELRDRLRKKGYTAYIGDGSKDKKSLQRVFIGPAANRAQALRLVTKLNKEIHIKGFVVNTIPTHH